MRNIAIEAVAEKTVPPAIARPNPAATATNTTHAAATPSHPRDAYGSLRWCMAQNAYRKISIDAPLIRA